MECEMFKNRSVPAKMKISMSLLGILFVGYSLFIYFSLNEIQQNATTSYRQSLPTAEMANKTKTCIQEVWQWLTDISATQGMDGLDDGFANAEKSKNNFDETIKKMLGKLEEAGDTEGIQLIGVLNDRFSKFYDVGKEMAKAYVDGGPKEGNPHMAAFDGAAETMLETLDQFVSKYQGNLSNSLAAMDISVTWLVRFMIGTSIAMLLIFAIVAWMMIRSTTGPLNRVITGLAGASEQVSSFASQSAGASQALAEGASEQAASLEETASSLEEMANMNRQNSDNAEQAENLVRETITLAEQGGAAMGRMGDAISEIKNSSDQTAKIIKTIDEIAFQTNLLALNAAVEAARAGDAGRGFAVVAEEVRNLAQRSAEAAKDTNELIESSQDKAELGVKVAGEVENSLNDIQTSILKINELVRDVATASKQQSGGIDQLNLAVTQMDSTTQNNAANAEETSATSEELSAQAQELNSMVSELMVMVGTGRGNGHGNGSINNRVDRQKTTSQFATVEHHPEEQTKGNERNKSLVSSPQISNGFIASGELRGKIERENDQHLESKPEQYEDLNEGDFQKI